MGLKARLLAAFDLLLLVFIPGNLAKPLWFQPPEIPIRFGLSLGFGLAALLSLLLCRGRLTLLAAQLDKLGCLHEMAADGEKALAALRHGSLPDVVLMDCDMPRLDG